LKENIITKIGFPSLSSWLLPLFVVAHFSHHVLTALPVPLLPMIRNEFALDYTQSGWVISAFTLSYGIAQLPAGWLADRIGPHLLMTIGISGVALAGFMVGLSFTYWMMIVFLVVMGILGGGYHPSAPPLISASVDPKNKGRALGIHVIGGTASYFVTPLIGVAIATIWGWRGPFIGLSIPAFVFGILFYMLLGKRPCTETKGGELAISYGDASPYSGRYHTLVVFMFLSTFTQAVIFSTIAFIPLFMVDHFGVGKEAAAAFLSIIYSAGIWASPLGGHLSDRIGGIPMILALCFVLGPLIFLLNLIPYGVGFGALLLSIGVILTMRMPVSEAYIIGNTLERNRSTILGIYYLSGLEGGGVLTPIMGYLIDQFGFYTSFTIAGSALMAVTLASSVFFRGQWNSYTSNGDVL
jgi:MFS family permease